MIHLFGGVAQLGERTVRIRKVESSILFISTKQRRTCLLVRRCFFAFLIIKTCHIHKKDHLLAGGL